MLNSLSLQPGDTIGIICTARWIEEEDLAFGVAAIREWGFTTRSGASTQSRFHQFAGEDALRKNDLQMFLDDPSVKAIICARGGYGTLRIIDQIDFTGFMQNPKWICGFSDITVLHTHINDKLGIPSIHSAMPVTFKNNSPLALDTLKNALSGIAPSFHLEAAEYNRHGIAEGVLIGGNLSILYALLGTKYGFGTGKKILFLEDLDEYLYHIDRMMMSLKLAGKLDQIAGLIVGGMTDMKDNPVPFGQTAEGIIASYFRNTDIPVCFGFPAGHQTDNRAFYLGKKIRMQVAESGSEINYL